MNAPWHPRHHSNQFDFIFFVHFPYKWASEYEQSDTIRLRQLVDL